MPTSISASHQVEHMSGPSFKNPPAAERVLSVQFRELAGFELVHYGMWFEKIRNDFPLTTRQGRLPPIVERFPAARSQRGAKFELELGPPLGRCVYSSADPSSRLLQLQPDRFAMNWRQDVGDEYVRFTETSRQFAETFQRFEQFCRDEQLPEPVVDLCEVTYMNRIAVPEGVKSADFFTQVFGDGILGVSADWLPSPAGLSFSRRFDFAEDKGRLYAEAALAKDSGGECLTLRMVGRTLLREDDQWRDRMQLAHDWVVNGFVANTQESVRRDLWGQQDA